jgi:hypothetical protein
MEFEIAPAPYSVGLVLGIIAACLLVAGLFLGWIAWSANALSVRIEGDRLRITAPLYGRSVPITALDLDRARIERLGKKSEIRPRIRTNGIGLPGYGVGWFRLSNGEKALAVIVGKGEVLYLPTTEGYVILLSAQQPRRLLDVLNRRLERSHE